MLDQCRWSTSQAATLLGIGTNMMSQDENLRAANGTAVVTGASSGIGAIYADRLAGRGYDLILVARRGDRLDALASVLRGRHGVEVTTMIADLADNSDRERVAASIAADTRITMLVNNAGTAKLSSLAEAGAAAAAAMADVNVKAVQRLALAALPGFMQRDRGTIINIGSILGFHSIPVSALYSATKSYMFMFTRALQEEVAGTGVIVQLVAPSATATDIWDVAGMPVSNLDPATVMTAEDCVDAALAGLDQGERVTLPSVEGAAELLAAYDDARQKLLMASQTSKAASRYRLAV